MKRLAIYTVLVILCLTISCCSISKKNEKDFEEYDIFNTEIKILKKYKSDNKEIAFLGIRHLGHKMYYENIKKEITNYQNQGYFVFYEGLTNKDIDTLILRKFRKTLPLKFNMDDIYVLNFKIVLTNFISDKIPNFKFPDNIIHQPAFNLLISNSLKSQNIDVSFANFVKTYEEMFGIIVLEDCDFKDKWTNTECYPVPHKYKNKIFIDYRDEFLVKNIITSKKRKILIIYGEDHYKGISENLLKNGFKIIN